MTGVRLKESQASAHAGGDAVRGPIEKRGRPRRPERRRAAVAHHVCEPGGPGAAGHGAAGPALGRPTVEHRLPDEGSAGQDLRRGREPKPRRCHQRLRRRGGHGRKPPVQLRARAAARFRGAGRWRRTPPPSPGSAPAPPLVIRRRMPAPPHQVALDAAHRPVVDSSSTSCSPSCPVSDTGPGAGGDPARSKLGLRRSTLTVGLQRILRGKARV